MSSRHFNSGVNCVDLLPGLTHIVGCCRLLRAPRFVRRKQKIKGESPIDGALIGLRKLPLARSLDSGLERGIGVLWQTFPCIRPGPPQ